MVARTSDSISATVSGNRLGKKTTVSIGIRNITFTYILVMEIPINAGLSKMGESVTTRIGVSV